MDKRFQILDEVIIAQPPDAAYTWTVYKDFRFCCPTDDGKISRFTVKAGATTDFASIPKAFQSIISKVGKHTKAAIVHDAIYRDPDHFFMTRAQADWVFYQLMLNQGVNKIKAKTMYEAVRKFAGSAWL